MEKAIQFLTEKPGLRKESKAYLATRIGCTETEVKNALKYLRTNPTTNYETFLMENGIDQRDVKAVWIKSKNNRSGIDFSVLKSNETNIKELIHEAFQDIEPFPAPVTFNEVKGDKIAIINIFDAHIDKLSYLSETGSENTVQKNAMVFMDAFYKLRLKVTEAKPEMIVFPVGSDFWQVNDSNLTTKKGTPQYDAVNTDVKSMFRLGIKILTSCIDSLLKIAPVHIIPVKGNHDEDRVFYLAEMLKLAYQNNDNLTIEENTTQRLYYRYHNWLFGFAHGDKEKKLISDLPSIMSVERRKDWSEIKNGVFFLGDIHHEKQVNGFKTRDFRGVNVKFLRAVSATDKWHYEHGYIGIPKTGYVFIYDREGNEEMEFKVNI
jgi:hypothetical protein